MFMRKLFKFIAWLETQKTNAMTHSGRGFL